MTNPPREASRERPMTALPGAVMLLGALAYLVALVFFLIGLREPPHPGVIVAVILTVPLFIISLRGFFVVNPNTGVVFVLVGNYKGTVRRDGFYWANPFASRTRISLKANNIASSIIKVNDLSGNPIEIGAVVVWQVRDTAQAKFDVEDYHHYVDVQIETAVRKLASTHPYEESDSAPDVNSLRGDSEDVSDELLEELGQRLQRAGIEVLESRISHLAYAPEIASAMLQRQQADAIIAARQKIVEGAVGMVEHALEMLGQKSVVQLDEERKATLVGNLLIVLCGHDDAQPVINTGSLYN